MRIVVTGASGNVGTGLLRRLAAEGRHEVVGVCRRPPAAVPPYDAATWRSMDVTAPDAVAELTEVFARAEAVVHLAWAIQPVHDEAFLHRTNVGGSRAVLAAATAAGVHRLVYASSLGVYAPAPEHAAPVDESWPDTGVPTSAYSRDKVMVERMLDHFEGVCPGITVARIRPPLVVQHASAGQLRRYFLGVLAAPWLLAGLRRGLLPVLPLSAGLRLQLVHADDVGRAIAAILRQRAGGIFNLAGDALGIDGLASVLHARRVLPLPEALARACAAVLWQLGMLPLSPGWFDISTHTPLLRADRARAVLDWSPSMSSRECLEELVAGFGAPTGSASPALDYRAAAARAARGRVRGGAVR